MRYLTNFAGVCVGGVVAVGTLRAVDVIKARSRLDRTYLAVADVIYRFFAPYCLVNMTSIMMCKNVDATAGTLMALGTHSCTGDLFHRRIMLIAFVSACWVLVGDTYYHTYVKNQQGEPLSRTHPTSMLAISVSKFVLAVTAEAVDSAVARFLISTAVFLFLAFRQHRFQPTVGYASQV